MGDDRGNDGSGHRDEAGLAGRPVPGVPGLEEARERHRAGDLREALRLYRGIVSAQPDCVDAILPAATIELQFGATAQALELVEAVIALRPDSAEPYLIRASALQALGRLDDAANSCGRALEIDPDFAGAYDMLGTVLVNMAKPEDAEAAYRCAIEIAPHLAGPHYNLGNLLQLRGKPDEAEAAYRRALEIVPDSAPLYACLGRSLEQLARFAEAEAAYRRAIDLAPDLAGSYNNFANMLQQRGKPDEAEAVYRRALELEPDSAAAHANLALVLQKLARLDEAESALRRAIEIEPGYAAAHSNLAQVLLERGDAQAALAACEACLEIDPLNGDTLAFKVVALDELGMHESVRYLTDFDTLVRPMRIQTPAGFSSLGEFNRALERQVCAFPTRFSETGTDLARQTQNLMVDSKGPLAVLQGLIRAAVEDYPRWVSVDAMHPMSVNRPRHWRLNAWATILKSIKVGEPIHLHQTAWLSGVYYVATPEVIRATDRHQAGWIEFGRSPSRLYHRAQPRLRTFQPEEGVMLLFPSYLHHRILPFDSPEIRMSVAFDVKPLDPMSR